MNSVTSNSFTNFLNSNGFSEQRPLFEAKNQNPVLLWAALLPTKLQKARPRRRGERGGGRAEDPPQCEAVGVPTDPRLGDKQPA